MTVEQMCGKYIFNFPETTDMFSFLSGELNPYRTNVENRVSS